MSKTLSCKKTGPSFSQNVSFSDNSGQNFSNKMEKSSKTEQKKKTLVSTFACFLIAIT